LKEVVGLLLAAGAGTRFGSDKLHHALPHGVPIAIQAARHLKAEIEIVFAVVRPGQEMLSEKLKGEGCEVVVCDNAAEGMGASLACAARTAGPRAAYVVTLGDMPFIRRSSIAAVRDALAAGAPLTAPYFRSKRGHPVGISGRFFQDLLSCKGDEGAKALLKAHEEKLVKIPVGDPGVLRDIDRPEDLAPPLAV
jgi:molybdenum cofactor cytidylyltransferase